MYTYVAGKRQTRFARVSAFAPSYFCRLYTLFDRIFEGDWRNIYDVDQKARKSPASREQDDQKFSRAVVRTAAERARGIPKDGGSGTKLCLVHS